MRLPAGSTRSTCTFSVLSVLGCIHTLGPVMDDVGDLVATCMHVRDTTSASRGIVRGCWCEAGDPEPATRKPGARSFVLRRHISYACAPIPCRARPSNAYVGVYVCTLTSWHCPISSADSGTTHYTAAGRFSVPKRQCRGESLCLARSCLRPPGYSVKEVQCVPYCTLSGCGRPGVGLRSAASWLSGRVLGKYWIRGKLRVAGRRTVLKRGL